MGSDSRGFYFPEYRRESEFGREEVKGFGTRKTAMVEIVVRLYCGYKFHNFDISLRLLNILVTVKNPGDCWKICGYTVVAVIQSITNIIYYYVNFEIHSKVLLWFTLSLYCRFPHADISRTLFLQSHDSDSIYMYSASVSDVNLSKE